MSFQSQMAPISYRSELETTFFDRIDFQFDHVNYKRKIGGKEMIVHCHHYNARLQGTIESVSIINGKEIIRSSAEIVFAEYFTNLFYSEESTASKWKLVEYMYSYLGYGVLDCSEVDNGFFISKVSHFVEGWLSACESRTDNICTFTEGYLQGAYFAIVGKPVQAHEVHCMTQGSPHCRFELSFIRSTPILMQKQYKSILQPNNLPNNFIKSLNIDEKKILDAISAMPLYGDKSGLIPKFNVYLANIPADFYNLVCIRFIEEMKKNHLEDAARKLLICCGEVCALHTFRGVMNSTEWDGLILPMIKERKDNLFALVTISNGLGWGNWHVKQFVEKTHLEMVSLNGYEAIGYLKLRAISKEPQCYMYTGVAAGLMELIYSEGGLEDKFGSFLSHETGCLCMGNQYCTFEVKRIEPSY